MKELWYLLKTWAWLRHIQNKWFTKECTKLFFENIPVILLVGDDYQLSPIMPGASANKANPKPSYGSVFVMGIVKKGLNAFNTLREKVAKLKNSKDCSAMKIC